MERFDVIVIGTGVAGQTAASELAAAGRSVAITDSREYGGTCSLRGCEPKKVLFTAAEVVERARNQKDHGLEGALRLDWSSLLAFKRSFTEPVPGRIEEWLAGAGVTLLHGPARFDGPDVLDIGGVRYSADRIVVATGAMPRPLRIPGEEHVLDSEDFLAAGHVGPRVVFVGGGYVSFEFAHIAAAAGAKVTILHRGPRVLEAFDPDLADMVVSGYRSAGIDVFTNATVTEVRDDDGMFTVVCEEGLEVSAETVVHGAGRVPAISGLGLEAAGIEHGRRGIEVDGRMCSVGNERVYAVGDASATGAPLTPVATAQARVAVADILEPGSAGFAPPVTPSVVFSDPILASVGMTVEQAEAQGIEVEAKLTDTSGWAASRRIGQQVSGAKTIVERGSGRVVGVHLLGHTAGEVINVFAVAMACGQTASDLKRAIWAYPTGASEIPHLF
ncbi:dihydrolipoyl dehydrogenase family protein [Anaerosoma tenue]|uniref:dihydrolipoyl dehydrogenase family protein n=1 Tax=Anaerosoma tenue TaxID=2933588 RepID=UPI002260CC5F|nr:NAD(P)/FAD-dependent oxidoreductase [Anaerosoma tenue]MCK8114506.1 NAD(P)/FAD-dependent oxidoreductase [Anaerosoma tenue]